MTTSKNNSTRPADASRSFRTSSIALAGVLALSGCALTPKGLEQERAALQAAGAGFAHGVRRADLPVPVDGNDWRTLLRRALIANGEVRAAWFEWKAALEGVSGASAWPNTQIGFGYSYMFSDESVKSFDRSSFDVGTDTMENLSFPGKTMAAGRVALAEAEATGERFRAAKFGVQRRLMEAWLELAMAAETARLADEGASLAGVGADVADASLRAGAEQDSAFTARIAGARRDDAAAAARADIAAARATLAALAAFGSPDDILVPTRLPHPRELPADVSALLAAVDKGPEVKGLVADRSARRHEEDLARLQWIPDINPYAAFTGSIEQGVGAAVMLPTTIVEIRSGIEAATAMRRAAASRLVQARRDKGAELRAELVAARDFERARRLLEDRVLPAAASAATAMESAYSAGRADLGDVVEARLLHVEARMEAATAAIERERRLAAIEEILGADLETFTDGASVRVAARTPAEAAGTETSR